MKPKGVDGDNGTSTWLTAGVLKPIEFIPRSEEAPNVPDPYLMQKQTESSLEEVQSLQSSVQQGHPEFRSTVQGLTTIVRSQGWRQLFAGLSINYAKVIRVGSV
ncbi:hypothetical protein MRB53_013934 [Persea americana]|uniref:Uncharacterized protein n=1 Tax=Persea americana TaxID=3435 RepID=A0ACC2K9L8_PERAE|nr:hypothetical protein MRB53_013934 [Persea americana]